MLSELPGDAEKRDAILDGANQTAGPEHRKGMSKKERKAETAAATAAAIIGSMFSSTQNVTLGTASTFDENAVIAPDHARPAAPKSDAKSGEGDAKDPQAQPAESLVPWIKIKQP